MAREIDVLQVLNNLKTIHRTGPNLFAGIPSASIESISDHLYKVTYLVLIFHKYFKDTNRESLLLNAITHDWAEAVLMDVPSGSPSFKSYFEEDIRGIFKKAEGKVLNEIFTDLEIKIPELTDKEKLLLDFADGIAILFEMIDYKQKGYNHEWIDRMFDVQVNKLVEVIEAKFEDSIKVVFKDMLSEVRYLFEQKYMVNKYLTKATRS